MPASNPAAPNTDGSDHTTGFDAGHAHDILRSLMENGAELVALLVKQASADPVPHPFWGDKAPVDHPTEHIARCYERITRSIRRTIALAKHLDDPPRPARHPDRAPRPANDAPARPAPEPGDTPESYERPESPDWDPGTESEQDLFARDRAHPLGAVIAEIETDLARPIVQPPRTPTRRCTSRYVRYVAPDPPRPQPDPPDPPTQPGPNIRIFHRLP